MLSLIPVVVCGGRPNATALARIRVFAGTPEIKIQSRWIGQVERVVSDVGIAVQSLRVLGMTAHWIGRHEPTHARRVVPSSKVIKPGLEVPFFAGELVGIASYR